MATDLGIKQLASRVLMFFPMEQIKKILMPAANIQFFIVVIEYFFIVTVFKVLNFSIPYSINHNI